MTTIDFTQLTTPEQKRAAHAAALAAFRRLIAVHCPAMIGNDAGRSASNRASR